MLSKPNVKEIIPKVGNRYESVLALAKRARQIESARSGKRKECKEKNVEFTEDMSDAVDIAAKEIADGKVYVKIKGEYAVTPESEMEREIKEAQEAMQEKEKEDKE